jgi:competence protein ComFC
MMSQKKRCIDTTQKERNSTYNNTKRSLEIILFQQVINTTFHNFSITKSQLFQLYNFIIHNLLEFIAPEHCMVCEKQIEANKSSVRNLCKKCYDSMPYAPEPDIIYNKFISNFPADELAVSKAFSLISLNENSNYMKLIYHLKYFGISKLGIDLGRELGSILKYYNAIDYDYIIPVPIHKARRRERGYNQSENIALGISKTLDLSTNFNAIIRNKYTQTQTLLSKSERMQNVKNIFSFGTDCKSLKMKNILLVDDVLTTGSTLNNCALTLLEAGARRVDVATLLFAS